ncbi:MAG: hypothetical protein RL030_394 [Pseudomonadota bacterium]|jgi:hypothetical protein
MLQIIAIGFAIVAVGLAIAVVVRPVDKWGFRAVLPGQPDVVMGTVALIGSALLTAFLLFVPVREGAAPSGKVYLAGLAVTGLTCGITQLSWARRQKRSRKQTD